MKIIGLLGGISHHTTIEYYNRIMNLYQNQFNDINYPEIIIYSLSHGRFKMYEDSFLIDDYIDYICTGIDGLLKSGAEVIALAANSPHRVLDSIQNKFSIPIVSAIDSAFNESKRLNIEKGLLLGIKFTLQSTFYQERFKRGGIDLITPDLNEQEIVNNIIFNKLIDGKDIDECSKDEILNIISNYSVDGVILGCMRLPVFFNNKTVRDINLVNTLDKHIEDILEYART
jgi:aspartate racemase